MVNEIWKDIVNYEGYYQISNLGNLRSLDREIDFYDRWNKIKVKRIRKGKLMSYGSSPNGYSICVLQKEGKINHFSIHRLVALAFIENIENLPQINHIDGNKKNNHVNNLEWTTPSNNILHAYNSLKVGNYKGVNQFSK